MSPNASLARPERISQPPGTTLIGHVRVSTDCQNPDPQHEVLHLAGCEKTREDRISSVAGMALLGVEVQRIHCT